MNTYNNGLRFYKTYYDNIDWGLDKKNAQNKRKFEEENTAITESKLKDGGSDLPLQQLCEDQAAIELVTMYPGLLMGTGITHGTGREGEIKVGFYFDHTTGLPVIPGSSVKGTLRSVFPLDYLKNAKKAKKDEKEILKVKADACKDYLVTEINKIIEQKNWTVEHIEDFERWLFGDNEAGKESQIPMSERVVFYDAYPVRMLKGDDLSFMGLDFITPHKEPLKDPNPIQFLKVMPGLVYRFQFRWAEYKKSDLHLTPDHLKQLFTVILQDIGIGAKTNVGYGQLLTKEDYLQNYGGKTNRGEGNLQPADDRPTRQSTDPGAPPPLTVPPKGGEVLELKAKIKAGRKEGDPRRIVFHTQPKNMIKGMKDKKGRFADKETDSFVTLKVRIRRDRRDEVAEIIEPKAPKKKKKDT